MARQAGVRLGVCLLLGSACMEDQEGRISDDVERGGSPNTDVNFAFGGAQTGEGNLTANFVAELPGAAAAQGLIVPGLEQQLDWAEATVERVNPIR
ncbi:MAG: hypothetical protein K0V04_34270, partial [Deltaproteobacteria bacterium]|nr:hypothetical protein [Deltaproteobacteria bacterium]